LHPRCAGLDVHKKTVVAAVRVVEHGKVGSEVRTFETTTAGLIALAEWLSEHGVTAVVLRTIYHMLKDGTCYEANRAECRVATRQVEAQRPLRRLARLGFAEEIKRMASTAG
jgi:hypothetical protein